MSTTTNYQEFSTRAEVVTRRTYNRPKGDGSFETWAETVNRVIEHQSWLWLRAKKRTALTSAETEELEKLRELMLARKATVSGRTLWLGGTDVAKTREASQFNCSFGRVETVHDLVDAMWLLLQGCGVGFEPVVGTLNGFAKAIEVKTIRSTKELGDAKGCPNNQSWFTTDDEGNKTYHLKIGDSAEAWAKALGKVFAMKDSVEVIEFDYTEVRAAGERLKGYGWISSGDATIHLAFERICALLNNRAGKLLTRINILDVLNHMGTTLSSRRSAEIALMPVDDAEVDAFISAKKDFWLHNNEHRQQSNNSVVFEKKPTKWELSYIFDKMVEAGGSEPGFINAEEAKRRAPHFKGVNPCAEILLGNKSFCNLVEVDWGKFLQDFGGLQEAVEIVARANYRQTCVNLDDGILQRSWHELNEFLRLCGVGATGIVKFLDHHTGTNSVETMLQTIRRSAKKGADGMADELGLPHAKLITTVKPSGTLSKIMDTTEGVHKPLGKFIFNNITFSKHDEIIPSMKAAGYKVIEKPFEPDSVLITFPVAYEDVKFDVIDGKEVNAETAIKQLTRYKLMMDNYVDHNCSVTISYDLDEVPAIIDWIMTNWDTYVGVSFIYRDDATKTAEDLGYAYLPQEVVTEEKYRAYANSLWPVNLSDLKSDDDLLDEGCSTGACPIR
jgi:adenosylcobalamin-dependent ribonucleoside-triphosphate reductase